MGNNLPSTYKTSLILQRENSFYTGGFCLSGANFELLKKTSVHFLHPREQIYLAGLQYTKRQQSFLLGRYCAKQAITAYLNTEVAENLIIENGIFQQPIVCCAAGNNIQVSITHTDEIGAAIAFPEAHPMAIDIENVCPNKIRNIKTQITPAEQKLFSLCISKESVYLTLLWTAKEALSKVIKCGLTIPMPLLEVKKIILSNGGLISYFENFNQYQAFSFFLKNAVCSIVYPRKTKMTLDILAIQKIMSGAPS